LVGFLNKNYVDNAVYTNAKQKDKPIFCASKPDVARVKGIGAD
jgi:hypothetical protein